MPHEREVLSCPFCGVDVDPDTSVCPQCREMVEPVYKEDDEPEEEMIDNAARIRALATDLRTGLSTDLTGGGTPDA